MRRITEVLAGEAASTAGTKVIDLNLTDFISRIQVQFKGTNNGATPTAHPAKMISKIELVDGSDVLFSMSGAEAQALNFYEGGTMPLNVLEFRNDVMAIAFFNLNFGRFLWDPKLAIDVNRFSNLQLKITHNMAAGGSAPDAGNLAVFAHVMDREDASPLGFLMSKEIQSYALTSSAHEYISLPTDYTFRKLMVASLAADKQPWEQYNRIKLSVDNDKQVLINNMRTSDLLKALAPERRLIEAISGTGTGAAVDHFITPAYEAYVTLEAYDAAVTTSFVNQSYGGVAGISFDSAEHFQGAVSGLAPHGAIDIPFGIKNEMDSWLKTDKFASLKIDITAGSSVGASSTCEVIAQQLRSYK